MERGDRLILWTMRSGHYLEEAMEYLAEHGVELWAVNQNPEQRSWTDSPKAYCHLYIDDAALGCPLVEPGTRRAYVDWYKIWAMLDLTDKSKMVGNDGK